MALNSLRDYLQNIGTPTISEELCARYWTTLEQLQQRTSQETNDWLAPAPSEEDLARLCTAFVAFVTEQAQQPIRCCSIRSKVSTEERGTYSVYLGYYLNVAFEIDEDVFSTERRKNLCYSVISEDFYPLNWTQLPKAASANASSASRLIMEATIGFITGNQEHCSQMLDYIEATWLKDWVLMGLDRTDGNVVIMHS